MTDTPEAKSEQAEDGADQKEWYREAEDALAKAGEALRSAWDASREARVSALQSAKTAAQQLGDAIERGVAGAKKRWTEEESASDEAGSTGEEEE
jgi:hypothetical protein